MKRFLIAATTALLVSCSSGSDATSVSDTVPGPTQPPPTADRCVVMLHGKGGGGGPSNTDGDGIVRIFPNGNQPDGGGRKWIYFPDDEYAAATKIVADSIAASSCKQVILSGFSNGAAFAAKLYCRGERFGGTVIGVVVDDPVPDAGTAGCAPDPATTVSLVWTGGLAGTATPGWNCSDGGWICDGGETVGIDAFAAALGVAITPSPFSDHQFWSDNPALSAWPEST